MDRASLGEGGILRQGKGRGYSEGGYVSPSRSHGREGKFSASIPALNA